MDNYFKKKSTKANSHHFFNIKNKSTFSHVKLNIFPDGGVARLRVYGTIENKKKFGKKILNLTSVLNGATPIVCNNEHFGRAENILAPGIGKIWEMDGKQEEAEEKILIGLLLSVLQQVELAKFKLTLIISKETIQTSVLCKLHI